jgi:hypothetical protein
MHANILTPTPPELAGVPSGDHRYRGPGSLPSMTMVELAPIAAGFQIVPRTIFCTPTIAECNALRAGGQSLRPHNPRFDAHDKNQNPD